MAFFLWMFAPLNFDLCGFSSAASPIVLVSVSQIATHFFWRCCCCCCSRSPVPYLRRSITVWFLRCQSDLFILFFDFFWIFHAWILLLSFFFKIDLQSVFRKILRGLNWCLRLLFHGGSGREPFHFSHLWSTIIS